MKIFVYSIWLVRSQEPADAMGHVPPWWGGISGGEEMVLPEIEIIALLSNYRTG